MTRTDYNGQLLLCPECKSMKILDLEERVCGSCGLVLGEIFGESSVVISRRDFRGGSLAPQFISPGNTPSDGFNLGGAIGYLGQKGTFADWRNQKISPVNQRVFAQCKRHDVRERIRHRETLFRVQHLLKEVAMILELTGMVRDRAAYMYARVIKGDEGTVEPVH